MNFTRVDIKSVIKKLKILNVLLLAELNDSNQRKS